MPGNSDWNLLKSEAGADDIKEFSKAGAVRWWSATEDGSRCAYYWDVSGGSLNHYNRDHLKSNRYAVRCVQ